MRFQTLGNARQFASVTVKSVEASVTIKAGGPVFFDPDATTRNGLAVLSAESLAAAEQGFFAGIALADIGPGKFGDAHIFGICRSVRVLLATRAASSDVWASYAAGAIGDIMSLNTGVDAQCVVRSGAGSASNIFWAIRLAELYASATTIASSIGGTSLFSVASLRCMIRAM